MKHVRKEIFILSIVTVFLFLVVGDGRWQERIYQLANTLHIALRTVSGTFAVYQVIPNVGFPTDIVSVEIRGADFESGITSVRFMRIGEPDIVASQFMLFNPTLQSTVLRAIVDLKDRKAGLWDVVVVNKSSQAAVLEQGFFVQQPSGNYLTLPPSNISGGSSGGSLGSYQAAGNYQPPSSLGTLNRPAPLKSLSPSVSKGKPQPASPRNGPISPPTGSRSPGFLGAPRAGTVGAPMGGAVSPAPPLSPPSPSGPNQNRSTQPSPVKQATKNFQKNVVSPIKNGVKKIFQIMKASPKKTKAFLFEIWR